MKAKFVFEAFGQKDRVRMEDIRTKSAGNHEKELSLASTQAAIIKNAVKAKARAEAAEEVFGAGSDIAGIFNKRAEELGGSYVKSQPSRGALAPVTKAAGKGEKLEREFKKNFRAPSERIGAPSPEKQEKPSGFSRGGGGGFSRGGEDSFANLGIGRYANPPELGGKRVGISSILPIGSIDLGSGESRDWNVIENDPTGTAEVWHDPTSNRHKIILTSGDKPNAKINDYGSFRNDQSWSPISRGDWTLVDYVPVKELAELVRIYGKSSMLGYVYK